MYDRRPVRAMHRFAIVAAVGGRERLSGPLARIVRFLCRFAAGFALASRRRKSLPNPIAKSDKSEAYYDPSERVASLCSETKSLEELVDLLAEPPGDPRFQQVELAWSLRRAKFASTQNLVQLCVSGIEIDRRRPLFESFRSLAHGAEARGNFP